jgi:hypothetical protein
MRQKLHHTLVTPRVFSCLTVLLAVSFVIAPLRGSAFTSTDRVTRESLGAEPHLRMTAAAPVLPAPSPSPSPTPVTSPTPYDIAPSSGKQGKDYEVIITSNQCLQDLSEVPPKSKPRNPLKDLQLYAPDGSGIRVTNSKATDCRVTAKLSIAADSPVAIAKLWLVDKDRLPQVVVDFAVAGITAGPIPPGLNDKGQVDVMWSVLPDQITNDNFGGKVAKQFYCVEVVIGNDSGFDLQLASIGFTLPGLANGKYRIPNSGYRTVRGSLEAFQLLAPRNFVVNGLKMLGPLLTGFLPFFHAASHTTNFSEAINLISNPLEKGVENFWPDLVPSELDRLADQTFRDDVSTKTIVPNNVQARILTFVPKQLLFPKQQGLAKGSVKIDNVEFKSSNPQDVMKVLGEIVIVGNQIDYVNRMRVVNNPLGVSASDRSISGKITDPCSVGVGGVTMTLSGGSDFTSRDITTSPDGTFNFPNVPIGRTYTVTPKLENMTFHAESPGSETFTLNDTKTNLNFGADYAVLVITGKITDKDSKPIKDVPVSLSPAGLADDVKTNDVGVFRFEVAGSKVKLPAATYQITPTLDKYTFDAATEPWKCDQRQVDFVATPKPSPSPTPKPAPAP